MSTKRYIGALLALSSYIYSFDSSPFLAVRSQGQDSARWLAGWTHKVNQWCGPDVYAALAITPEYTHSYNPDQIANNLFGADVKWGSFTPFLKVTGSAVAGRHPDEWLADYLGLPPDFQSTITFNPTIQNFILDLNLYVGINKWVEGLYLNFFIPFVHTRWDLGLCEKVIDAGSQGYLPGYFAPTAVSREQLLHAATEFLSDGLVPDLGSVTFSPLERSKMSRSALSKTGFADLHAVLGWNFIQDEDYHLGLNFRAVIPTGTKPTGEFLFEPVVGNGHFTEFGLGLSTHGIIWRHPCLDKEWGLYIEAWVTHLDYATQRRSFDLKTSDGSRYMPMLRMTDLIVGDLNNGGLEPNAQFDGFITPLANLSTLPVSVDALWQADFTLMFNYKVCNWEFDAGYNFWSKRPENIKFQADCKGLLNELYWGSKGDAQLYGYRFDNQEPVALSATQSRATISRGTNRPGTKPGEYLTNPGIDNPKLAFADAVDLMDQPGAVAIEDQINTSIQPIFTTTSSLSLCRTATHGYTNAIFGHINYTFNEYDDCWYRPYLGIGGKIEMGYSGPENGCDSLCTNIPGIAAAPCGTCDVETLLQAGISQVCFWVKGGASF